MKQNTDVYPSCCACQVLVPILGYCNLLSIIIVTEASKIKCTSSKLCFPKNNCLLAYQFLDVQYRSSPNKKVSRCSSKQESTAVVLPQGASMLGIRGSIRKSIISLIPTHQTLSTRSTVHKYIMHDSKNMSLIDAVYNTQLWMWRWMWLQHIHNSEWLHRFVDYGQKGAKEERRAAGATFKRLNVELLEMDLSPVGDFFRELQVGFCSLRAIRNDWPVILFCL